MPFDRELVEAKLALEMIPSQDMPSIAWDALEAGIDGRWIRRLGALERLTFFEVAEVLPKAKAEMGLGELPAGKAALIIAKRRAREILQSEEDPLRCTRDFESLWIRANYCDELATVGNLFDDVWIAESTGQTPAQIRKWITEKLKELLA